MEGFMSSGEPPAEAPSGPRGSTCFVCPIICNFRRTSCKLAPGTVSNTRYGWLLLFYFRGMEISVRPLNEVRIGSARIDDKGMQGASINSDLVQFRSNRVQNAPPSVPSHQNTQLTPSRTISPRRKGRVSCQGPTSRTAPILRYCGRC